MKIGIVGLPNVGKSTLFKALTRIQVDISNYPFCTIEPNIGIVEVPDRRVDRLAEMFSSRKKIYATTEFVDIAGLVAGASQGEGLGNKFLSHIREVDAIVQVVRAFENEKIIHTQSKISPLDDIAVINTELLLADAETIEKKLSSIEREAKRGDKTALKTQPIAQKLKDLIDQGDFNQAHRFSRSLSPEDFELIQDFHLLCFKPTLYLFNATSEKSLPAPEELKSKQIDNWLSLNIKNEEDILSLSDEEKVLLELKSELDQLIISSYKMLSLINFLTAGETETRSWTIPKNSTAPRAGRAIHGDFEKKFICAEIIAYDKLMEAGSKTKAKELGWLRTEGKSYIVQDGDVIEFRV